MRIEVSMGFLAFRNGRVQFSRVRLATIASTPAIPEGFFVIELGIQRSLRHSCCGQNDAQVSASKYGPVYPATIALGVRSRSRGTAPLHLGLFLACYRYAC